MSTVLLPFGILLCLTAAGLLLPMVYGRSSRGSSRAEGAGAVLRDKLAQVAHDREVGLLGAAEAAGAEAEISRELIATAREAEFENAGGPPRSGGVTGVALAATLVLGGSIWIYQFIGSYDLPDQPLASREIAPETAAPTLLSEHDGTVMNDAIISLRQRLEQDPSNADQWLLLARSYSAVGADAEAAEAYAKLIELAEVATQVRGDYAETLVRAEGGFVGPAAIAQFEAVLANAPDDPRGLYYMAMRDAQNGDSLKAAQGWAKILRDAPAGAPYSPAIREILDRIIDDASLDRAALDIPAEQESASVTPGPSAEDVAAVTALPEEEQLNMIRGMVARLEDRLAEEPGDIDGWLRLARSRAVLGEPGQAVAALEQALKANPGDQKLESALLNMRNAAGQ